MSLRRATIVALFGLLALVGLGGTASAQPYPPSEGEGSVSRTTVEPGGTVEFCGDGFAPDTEVVIRDNGEVVETVTTDENGEFCVTLTLEEVGTHVLTGTGIGAEGEVRTVTATVTVVAAGGLPATGSNTILPAIGVGLGLVTLGTFLLYAVRRQRARGLATA
jgi:LPXTG-motif cell wall-anchored protein